MELPIASYADPPSDSTRLINCYIETPGPQGTGPVLHGFPGIDDFTTVGNGPIRAVFSQYGIKYVISDNKAYKVVGINVFELGTVSGTARPQIVGNGPQIAFLVEPNLWVYTIATDTFAQVSDVDFPGASSIQFFDNYITYTEASTGRWGSSDLADAISYDGLFFATAEGSPDRLVGHVVDHRQAFLLGTDSCELWDNAGVSGFPFVRAANGFIEIGCLSGSSACKVDQSIIWLASDRTVRRLEGATPVRISTHAVERAIKGYTTASAHGQSFTFNGHVFYVLTFPEATWCFDVTTGQWFELQSYGLDNWRGACSSQDGDIYVGDSESNKLGKLTDVYDEFGDEFVMTWTYAPTFSGGYVQHSRLEIFGQMGVGLPSGQGSDPRIMLAKSDDGGASFIELPTRSMGAIGNRLNRAVWYRLGRSRNRVYRASISDPVKRKITATRLEAA